jgi:hypothetical protein
MAAIANRSDRMNTALRGGRRPAAAATILLLLAGACQPLPHPFAHDVPPPGSSMLRLPDMASVSIAPLQGGPRATALKLGPAMAKALQDNEIAASTRTAGLDSYALLGRIQAMPPKHDEAALVVLWELRDPSGNRLGARAARVVAKKGDWEIGNDDAVARLAAAGAEQLAGLMQEKAPAEAAVGGRTRLLIGGVAGAPGDGAKALKTAITLLLKRQDVAIVSDPQAGADLVLAADVGLDPPRAGQQHVKIVWHVRRKNGDEIGTVAQENDVPTGLLDGAWGDVAYTVAVAAQDGIMALVVRGASPQSRRS